MTADKYPHNFCPFCLVCSNLKQIPLLCFISVPPEITTTQINKWRVADMSREMDRVGERDGERKRGGKREETERGHGKGKIKEKVVKRCVLVLSWCLPAGLDTIPQLCLSLTDSNTHTHLLTCAQNIYSLHQTDLSMNPERRLLTGHALYPSWPAPS